MHEIDRQTPHGIPQEILQEILTALEAHRAAAPGINGLGVGKFYNSEATVACRSCALGVWLDSKGWLNKEAKPGELHASAERSHHISTLLWGLLNILIGYEINDHFDYLSPTLETPQTPVHVARLDHVIHWKDISLYD
jgi:hypothetical protein